eukprot:1653006-Lingulodinium_polyedra.AAC.1
MNGAPWARRFNARLPRCCARRTARIRRNRGTPSQSTGCPRPFAHSCRKSSMKGGGSCIGLARGTTTRTRPLGRLYGW